MHSIRGRWVCSQCFKKKLSQVLILAVTRETYPLTRPTSLTSSCRTTSRPWPSSVEAPPSVATTILGTAAWSKIAVTRSSETISTLMVAQAFSCQHLASHPSSQNSIEARKLLITCKTGLSMTMLMVQWMQISWLCIHKKTKMVMMHVMCHQLSEGSNPIGPTATSHSLNSLKAIESRLKFRTLTMNSSNTSACRIVALILITQ